MSKQGSATWLIIFLCAILMFFGWLAINGQYLKQINNLNNQINELTKKAEQIEKSKNEEIDKLKKEVTSYQAMPSAAATPSGEKE